MTLLEMFEKVNIAVPLEQRRFFNYYEDSVDELQMKYREFVFPEDTNREKITSLSDENRVRPLYHTAIVDNILFLAGAGGEGNAQYKNEFMRKARDAYMTYWRQHAKGKHIRRMMW